ncbi:MAG: ester cyclase [Actinomycetota bacterium]|nr:ester cyclase [Actinomycetota bacterium]MDQ3642137.1 ester cyclase [Actinomycetota bacterium]
MGEAREVFDRFNGALLNGDLDAAAACYAENAVAVTPDQGEIQGREGIREYLRPFVEAFSDMRFDFSYMYESGNHAIDEGYLVGTHTGPLPTPTGETIPPTGRAIRIRDCDIVTVEGGVITSHRFYFDQMEFLSQLGLIE